MKPCPLCGEWNGDNRAACFRCGANLKNSVADYQKICPACQKVYPQDMETCPQCGARLGVHSPEAWKRATEHIAAADGPDWGSPLLYVIAFLIPLAGVVIGLVKGAAGNFRACCAILLASLAGGVVWKILFSLIFPF